MKPGRLALLVAVLAAVSACSGERLDSAPESSLAQPIAMDLEWLFEKKVHEPQFLVDEEGSTLLVWREKTEAGSDLFVARREEDGGFAGPVRINDEADTVESYPHDEMRAALAAGSNGSFAVAWADSRGQIRAALSSDGAATFAPSIRLDQTETQAYRGFPALAFDASGALHAVWIDSRFAEGLAEEPADLFYARVVGGLVTESNVTAEQEPTVCGCCRTHLAVGEDGVARALFRNASADGYRDIYTVSNGGGREMSAPTLVGQPLWMLEGCPMSGPIFAADRVLWPDGSSGRKLLMMAELGSDPATPLFSDEQRSEWGPRLSPRAVSSATEKPVRLLLPGRPSSRLVAWSESDSEWRIEAEDLPPWATSALFEEGLLVLIGAVGGELQVEQRAPEA